LWVVVATLALGSQPRLKLQQELSCKVANQEKDPGVTSHALQSAKSVREWTFTFPSELPL
jgi:hypothetical protein